MLLNLINRMFWLLKTAKFLCKISKIGIIMKKTTSKITKMVNKWT